MVIATGRRAGQLLTSGWMRECCSVQFGFCGKFCENVPVCVAFDVQRGMRYVECALSGGEVE